MILFRLFSRLPFPVLYLFSDILFFFLYYIFKYRLKVVDENLKNSFPDKNEKERKKIAKQFYHNLCDIVFESWKSLSISKADFEKRNKLLNPEVITRYLNGGRSVIGLTGHLCNWEWLLLINSMKMAPYPVDAIYRPLLIKFFDKLVLAVRTRFGAFPVPMKETMRYFVKRKSIVRGIAMVADQSPYFTEVQYSSKFLNQDTPFFVGAQKLAMTTGYPVVYIGMRRVKRGHYEIFYKPIAEGPYDKEGFEIIDRYKEILEEEIVKFPSDWLWTHKRWKYSEAWKKQKEKRLNT